MNHITVRVVIRQDPESKGVSLNLTRFTGHAYHRGLEPVARRLSLYPIQMPFLVLQSLQQSHHERRQQVVIQGQIVCRLVMLV